MHGVMDGMGWDGIKKSSIRYVLITCCSLWNYNWLTDPWKPAGDYST